MSSTRHDTRDPQDSRKSPDPSGPDQPEGALLDPEETSGAVPDPDAATAAGQREEERQARHTDSAGAGSGGVVREQSVGRASALMAAGSLVSRPLGLVRQLMLVACLGVTGAAADAFNTANQLPNTIYMLLSGGLLTAVLIPQITKAMKRPDGGQDVVDRLLTICIGAILLVAALATALAYPLVVLYQVGPAARGLATAFAIICLPQIFFYGLYAVLGQVLNARGRYASFMWTPVLANLVQIVGMGIFLWSWGTRPQVWTPPMIWLLAGTSTAGIALQALALVPDLRASGFRWRPRWGFRGYGFRSASTMAGWAFAALAVAQLGGYTCVAVMNRVAGWAHDSGQDVAGVTVYQLAFLIFMLPHGVITVSILTALYPRMSRAVHDADTAGLRRLVTRGLTMPSVALVPVTAVALPLAVPGMSLVPGVHGHALGETALVFAIMVLGLIPFGWTTLQQRFLFALEDGRTNLYLQALLTAVQVAAALLALAGPREHVVALIAVGQTVGNLVAALAFVVIAGRRVGGLPLQHIVRLHVRLTLVSALSALATWGVVELGSRLAGSGTVSSLLQLAVGGLVFALLFFALSRVFHLREVDELLSPLTTRLRRRTSAGTTP
ncbi:murein biosynthesis integral membrane protein MurJ [Arsenicicoccus sp. oral taxon 190]|uniref:murein biosynthesis integral membrane protein MurJ n=1 Tax=Arsenicicoccus sp. oral taxon 190 TaxID=1658671 RepID=UPI000679F38C|nr:murein biosynthesis integral membrane protein MurJ [Arsenicicoccus sp. oral taxon 190]AKT50866.1 hypothetical protein ADJ73_05315 [Arsenicicoccus sp. oral taxon 190]